MIFSLSVIIPVYNGELFIEKAIHSAVIQPEVTEVIVINDGSTDETQRILDRLKQEIAKLKVVHHTNKLNKGRSASRNLGIKVSTGNYIAFLDADDYYLENRFKNDLLLFEKNENIDGVYNAIGVHFYREANQNEKKQLQLTTVKEAINSRELFEILLLGTKNYFSIDGLTVNSKIFDKTGYFSESLVVAEDTELILKMALKATLVSGVIDTPLAIRGVHEDNSFSNEELYKVYRYEMYHSLLNWVIKNNYPINKIDAVLRCLFLYRKLDSKNLFIEIKYWFKLLIMNPTCIKSLLFFKSFPLIIQRKKFLPLIYKFRK
ncbi:glycosyltransferase family 2 protein [Polaribacter sp. ALD11]|uniref:glycosyltransferase family 2 protein n=1 Tax=Polaribacter sp. ALD11 TaxID=2058137 RepID=UPI000C307CFF|nr:glycosyltransferase family 2 protein [Polaribacter sp. ALD11]AUC84424.1 glycosyltransferase family 2 protein [Polaribacter sp. ALD11]